MRTPLLFCITLMASAAAAQCDFDPVITTANDILCPGETTLLEVGDFDGYQWFQDGNAISQEASIVVDHFNSGSQYTVAVTLDDCTETSPSILIDGWAFLPPFVIQGGDEPIAFGPNGEAIYCEGQVVELEMSNTYTQNIVWTNNGIVIPNENEQILTVTESGVYNVSGSPEICPNYSAQVGVDVVVDFIEPQQPSITVNDDELCAFPLGLSYTWYQNGEELDETGACIVANGTGAYTVYVDYGQDCQVISEPHLITGLREIATNKPWVIYPNPTNGTMNITMDAELSSGAFYAIFDMVGQEVASGWMPLNGLVQLDLYNLSGGTYLFQAARNGKALAPASRFTIVK